MGSPLAEGTLVKLLLDNGYHVYRVTLKGHCGPIEDMQNVTLDEWKNQAYLHYCAAKSLADDEGLPLYFLGFSLGALIYEYLITAKTAEPVQFEKAILFSPAIALRPYTKLILWVPPYGNKSIVKSASPKEYHSHIGTSMAAYKALFSLQKSFHYSTIGNCNVDTIIFIDKKDELISFRLLRKIIKKNHLTNWEIHEVSNKGTVVKPIFHHLLIDSKCVSPQTWQYISQTIISFLSPGSL